MNKLIDREGNEVVLKDNVGGWCRYYLHQGKLTNKEIVEKVRERFGSKTTVASVAWYKNELREKGIIAGGKVGAKVMSLDQFESAE